MKRVAPSRRVVFTERGARLERGGGDAADMEFHADDMVGAGERRIGGLRIAKPRVDQDVVRDLVPDRGCARYQRRLGVHHPGQLRVIDIDRLGRVERLAEAFGDHHRHRLADMAHLVRSQQPMRADEYLAAARRGQFHVVTGRRYRLVRDGFQPGGAAILAAIGAEHARHGARPAEHDAVDTRMRIGRAHHDGIDLA